MPKIIAEGVQFPSTSDGKRSTIAGGVAVWAAAARAVSAPLADEIARSKPIWRDEYPKLITRLVEQEAYSTERAIAVAEAGLASVHSSFEFVRGGKVTPLDAAMHAPDPDRELHTGTVTGTGALATSFEVPYFGEALSGDAFAIQVLAWAEYGALEPAGAQALCEVTRHPEWLDLRGRTFVLLGATAELGPLRFLLRCGATVVAIARGNPAKWDELILRAQATTGTLVFPLSRASDGSATDLSAAAGADLLTETPEIYAWLAALLPTLPSPATIGTYTYLDGELNVRISVACDAICARLAAPGGPATALAFVQTPSQAFVVPKEAVNASDSAYAASRLRYVGYPGNSRPAVPTASGEPRFVHDGFISVQGPNYALAKAINLWRAVLARSRDGLLVSSNVAPACRTASMQQGNKNARLVAAALAGMGNFPPMLVFDAATVSAVMAVLLVHDVCNPDAPSAPASPLAHPWDLFSCQSFHGGSFRVSVKPQALGRLFGLSGFIWPSDPRPMLVSVGASARASDGGAMA
jgi:hypothetical protein